MARHSDSILSAIKSTVDIVTLVGDYVRLRRAGSKYKGLCPFHQDHNPSLEVNPDRQSYKCWSCGAGGDIFDFVKNIEHVEFPEALRMLADRAGITLERERSPIATAEKGPSKSDLLAVNSWAEELYARALEAAPDVLRYVDKRGLSRGSVERFRMGYAPETRGWLLEQARKKGIDRGLLEEAGLIAESPDEPGVFKDRFRGRLIFPIHDDRGRTVGFGGRILPEVQERLTARGLQTGKYLNTAETILFHKRNLLYAADLARNAAREAGWVAVVEGYTDVIAAHQVGVFNVVGTLGTALGEDHIRSLKRLSDRVVLVFDGDQAGQSAADRALEMFMGSGLDLRVLTLPANLDPCDFVLKEGADAFRKLVNSAPEALTYLVNRATTRFDVNTLEGSRRAAEWAFGILNQMPETHRLGLDVTKAKVLDTLAHRLRIPPEALNEYRRQLRRPGRLAQAPAAVAAASGSSTESTAALSTRIRQSDLDRTDLELMQIILSEPSALASLVPRVAVSTLRDAPLRTLLQACYELQNEGLTPSYDNLMIRVTDPAIRELAAGLIVPSALSTPDPGSFSDRVRPAPWRERLESMRIVLHERERQSRLRDLKRSRDETDQHADPEAYRAIKLEYQRLLTSGRTSQS